MRKQKTNTSRKETRFSAGNHSGNNRVNGRTTPCKRLHCLCQQQNCEVDGKDKKYARNQCPHDRFTELFQSLLTNGLDAGPRRAVCTKSEAK